jgi:thiol-disulfide isomerase/thioredoxin
MTRRQVIGFVVVLGLIGAGLLLRARPEGTSDVLPGLRKAAALQPCPAGLGPELPDVTLPCLGGGPSVRVRAAGPGRPTLVNIWGSWCLPCRKEVPALVRLADKAGDRLLIVGIDTIDDPVDALTFAKAMGMHYPSLVDDDKRILRTVAPGPPVTLLLDAAGHVQYTHLGTLTSSAQLEHLVHQHLGLTL